MNGDVGVHHAKIEETRRLLSNTSKDTSTIMCNPLSEYAGRVMHDCAIYSILDSMYCQEDILFLLYINHVFSLVQVKMASCLVAMHKVLYTS